MRRVLLSLAVLGCEPASSATSVVPEETDVASEHDAAEPGGAAGDAEAEPGVARAEDDALPAEQRAILDGINARYAEQTNVRKWKASFEREGREVHDRRDEVVAALQLEPGSAVADVGAGTGLFTMRLSEVVGDEGRVYAVDIQPYFLEHLAKRAKDEGRSNVEVVEASAESAGLPAGSVDLVLMCDAYHHIEQPLQYLATLHAALREDGRLAIVDYHRGPPGEWRYDHIRATAGEFRREIESAGFQLQAEHDFLEENFFYVFRRI